MPLRAVVEASAGQPVRQQRLLLQASVYDEEQDEDVEVPTISYRVALPA